MLSSHEGSGALHLSVRSVSLVSRIWMKVQLRLYGGSAMRVHCLRAAILLLSSIQGFAQTSDPQATALATKSIAALTGGNSISDASLTGDVTWSAGSDIEMGTGTF